MGSVATPNVNTNTNTNTDTSTENIANTNTNTIDQGCKRLVYKRWEVLQRQMEVFECTQLYGPTTHINLYLSIFRYFEIFFDPLCFEEKNT